MNEITISIDALRQLIDAGRQTEQCTPATDWTADPIHPLIGKWVLIRGDRSGVFVGTLARLDPVTSTVELDEARHIWSWQGAANTAEIAAHGVAQPKACKFVAAPDRIQIWDVIELIPCTPRAEKCLRAVPLWSEAS